MRVAQWSTFAGPDTEVPPHTGNVTKTLASHPSGLLPDVV